MAARVIFVPDLHIDTLRQKTRDFRLNSQITAT